ncbi:cytochrome P450 [Coniophora puteana RWD-64-598 SS2]|uniref:Cytochrome P450 n=1 Tax=Coniophora puteana (strain RWD-64-598) TaxID=741705 RepID=R7SCZ0_CONPW|nr:cytochrome P450 [Coniophora puteana RWD-64-598 SS2]EIW74033.1 cytochrome P450 [Coniophora puteana RWD-64-598 SS2]
MAPPIDLSTSISSLDRSIAIPGFIATLILAGALLRKTKKRSDVPLPPSPAGAHWLNGHAFPQPYPFLQVERWIEEYGPVITVKQGRQTVVIVGRHQAAFDIMEKQGGSSVDRPRTVAAGEILSGDHRLVFTGAGDRFKRMRKAVHSHLQPKAAESYETIQLAHVRRVILNILDRPGDFQLHAKAYAASVVLQVAYGKMTPTSASDPDVQAVHRALDHVRVALQPNAYLVDSFPFLKYIPWYANDLKEGYKADSELYMRKLTTVREQIKSSDAGPSFSRFLLETTGEHKLNKHEMAYLAGTFFAAGSDTTSLAICTVFMCAALFPQAQAAVQEELDSVIGRDRLPTFSDERSLPRLKAFISEALRWRPIVAMGIQHRTTEDVFWGNYCIPAGTTVVGNHWAISRDPEVFPNPERFDPQRWINSKGQMRDDLKYFTFGFGRRVCPGQHVANRSVFINGAMVMWSFRLSTLTPPADDMVFMSGVTPVKRVCDIKFEPRVSEKDLRAMIENYGDDL